MFRAMGWNTRSFTQRPFPFIAQRIPYPEGVGGSRIGNGSLLLGGVAKWTSWKTRVSSFSECGTKHRYDKEMVGHMHGRATIAPIWCSKPSELVSSQLLLLPCLMVLNTFKSVGDFISPGYSKFVDFAFYLEYCCMCSYYHFTPEAYVRYHAIRATNRLPYLRCIVQCTIPVTIWCVLSRRRWEATENRLCFKTPN